MAQPEVEERDKEVSGGLRYIGIKKASGGNNLREGVRE